MRPGCWLLTLSQVSIESRGPLGSRLFFVQRSEDCVEGAILQVLKEEQHVRDDEHYRRSDEHHHESIAYTNQRRWRR